MYGARYLKHGALFASSKLGGRREHAALTDGSTAVRSATTLQIACRTLAQQCLLVTFILPSPDPGRPQALVSKDN
jgi:hypothetical protein